jgi:hypothetical protein
MTVADLLMSQRRWGLTRCRKVLGQIPISETKTVGSLTDRQRRALALLLAPAGEDERRHEPDARLTPAAVVA